jgi:hypothetical protein
LNNTKIIILIFVILSASTTPLMIFDQYAQGQTPTLTVNYTCNENNVPIGTITLNGFPEGNTAINRSQASTGLLFLGNFLVPSSGTYIFPSADPDILGVRIGEPVTYIAFSDPNLNLDLDPGEVSASTTLTFLCLQPPTSPPQQIQNLINTISQMNLDNSIRNSLTAPLNQAVNLLEDNNPNNDVSVCNQLNAFIEKVNAQKQNNRLSQEQANQLIQAAQSIRNALNCS